MAISNGPTVVGTSATVATATTSVVPLIAIPDNCHTIVITNVDAAETIYAKVVAAGGALPATSSINVPSSSSLTLPIGVLSDRVGAYNLVYAASANGVVAYITYVLELQS
jgi:hypothetical protein|tara:strand:- start:19 stop:348 length:330 start_codon:yes stop_codon:yes gene_type:complete